MIWNLGTSKLLPGRFCATGIVQGLFCFLASHSTSRGPAEELFYSFGSFLEVFGVVSIWGTDYISGEPDKRGWTGHPPCQQRVRSPALSFALERTRWTYLWYDMYYIYIYICICVCMYARVGCVKSGGRIYVCIYIYIFIYMDKDLDVDTNIMWYD